MPRVFDHLGMHTGKGGRRFIRGCWIDVEYVTVPNPLGGTTTRANVIRRGPERIYEVTDGGVKVDDFKGEVDRKFKPRNGDPL